MNKLKIKVARGRQRGYPLDDDVAINNDFGMAIPSHIVFSLADMDYESLGKMRDACLELNLSSAEYCVGTRAAQHGSSITLYKGVERIANTQYEDCDKKWDTFDPIFIRVCFETLSGSGFYCKLAYFGTNNSHFEFKTSTFSLEEFVPSREYDDNDITLVDPWENAIVHKGVNDLREKRLPRMAKPTS